MTRSSQYRDIEDAMADQFVTEKWGLARLKRYGGRQRAVDWWLVWGIRNALATIHKGRWNFDPEVRVALLNTRGAVADLDEAMRRSVRQNWDKR